MERATVSHARDQLENLKIELERLDLEKDCDNNNSSQNVCQTSPNCPESVNHIENGATEDGEQELNDCDNENHMIVEDFETTTAATEQMNRALQIDLILIEIQKNLSHLSDLLNFRRVSKQWCSSVDRTAIIVNKCFSRELHFVFKKSINGYCQEGRIDFTLSRFNKSFHQLFSNSFPFTMFSFENGNFATPDVNEFLSLFGTHVTKLRLKIRLSDKERKDGIYQNTIATFRRLLLHDVPNLEHLIIEGTAPQWDRCYRELFPSPCRLLQLPRLKCLTFGAESVCSSVIREVSSAACNVQKIFGVCTSILSTLNRWAPSTVRAIKCLTIGPCCEQDDVDMFDDLSQLEPQLERIVLHYQDAFEKLSTHERLALGHVVTKFLASSSSTLEKIMLCPLAFVPTLILPILPKVRKITFCDTGEFYHDEDIGDYRIFSGGQKMSEIFPNVRRIEFNMEAFKCHRMDWNDLFEGRDRLISVKDVILYDLNRQAASSWFKRVSKLLPNVENLHILTFDAREAPELFVGIWAHFRTVKTIKFNMRLYEYDDVFCDLMDSAISGISQPMCINLREKFVKLTNDEVAKFREGPSILDLHDLTSLIFEFDIRFLEAYRSRPVLPVFSLISNIYGFEPLKKRQDVHMKISTYYPATSKQVQSFKDSLKCVLASVDDFTELINDED